MNTLSRSFTVLLLALALCLGDVRSVAANDRRDNLLTVQQRTTRATPCKLALQLVSLESRAFCLAYLHGRLPDAGTTVTQPASVVASTVTPTTVITNTATVQTNSADSTTTTTVTSTTQVPAAVAAQRRTSSTLSSLSLLYPADVITDACLLFLYGRLSDPATTTRLPATTTTVYAPTSTRTTVTTLSVTKPATTTITKTITSVVTSTSTSTTTSSTSSTSSTSTATTTTTASTTSSTTSTPTAATTTTTSTSDDPSSTSTTTSTTSSASSTSTTTSTSVTDAPTTTTATDSATSTTTSTDVPTPTAVNIVYDGSFEQTDVGTGPRSASSPNAWELANDQSSIDQDASLAYAGSRFLVQTSNDPNRDADTHQDNLTGFVAGQTYSLTYARRPVSVQGSGQCNSFARLVFTGGYPVVVITDQETVSAVDQSSTYAQRSTSFTAPSSTAVISVQLQCGSDASATFYYDDFRVTAQA